MVDYRSILRLHSQGNSQREIEREVNSSRHTISEVLIQAEAAGITWPLDVVPIEGTISMREHHGLVSRLKAGETT
jgi:hypothetical protein